MEIVSKFIVRLIPEDRASGAGTTIALMLGSPTAGGEARPEAVTALLPDGWTAAEERTLDLDRATRERTGPHSEAAFDLIWGRSEFARATADWPELLLEVHRLLSPEGLLIAGLGGPEGIESMAGERADENKVGMTVLAGPDGVPVAFHSEWWLRAHWGRAFEVARVDRSGPELWVLLRRRAQAPSAAALRRPEPGEEREQQAAAANVELLLDQLSRSSRRHRAEMDSLREELGRELMRKSFEAAHLEWATRGPDSPATDLAAAYEATLSWRVTRPLRAAGSVLRRARDSRAG